MSNLETAAAYEFFDQRIIRNFLIRCRQEIAEEFDQPIGCHIFRHGRVDGKQLRLIKFLSYFLAAPDKEIPNNSLIKEFVGGSCFKV